MYPWIENNGCVHRFFLFVAELTMWESDGGRSPTVTSVSDLGWPIGFRLLCPNFLRHGNIDVCCVCCVCKSCVSCVGKMSLLGLMCTGTPELACARFDGAPT